MLRKRDIIIAKVNTRIKCTIHKYRIEIPRDFNHTSQIDTKNKNTIWRDTKDKEMKSIGVTFDILETGEVASMSYKKTSGQIVFDIKIDFTRKAQWVINGHKNSVPERSTYARVVSRESTRITFTYTVLNDIDIYVSNMQNAYI